jgi:hypothetical protein
MENDDWDAPVRLPPPIFDESSYVAPAPLPVEPAPLDNVVTTAIDAEPDPWHAPWQGECSPAMREAIQARLQAGVMPIPPQDLHGSKYPLLSLAPYQSLVWTLGSDEAARVLANRVGVHINRVGKRTGRQFMTKKVAYKANYIVFEVTRVPVPEA